MEGDYWDSEQDKKLAQEMWAGYLIPRRREIKNISGNLICMRPRSNIVGNANDLLADLATPNQHWT